MTYYELAKKVEGYSKNGVICQADGDGGDSAYRTALFSFLCTLKPETERIGAKYLINICISLQVKKGVYIRFPGKYWYSNPDNFSRDQASKVVLAMCTGNYKHMIKVWLKAMRARFFFHQNHRDGVTNKKKLPDIMLPGEWANLIRGLELKKLKPLLEVLDFRFFIDLIFRKNQLWDYDSLMCSDLIYAKIRYPTWASTKATKLYLKTDFRQRISYNYADINNGIEPLGDLYIVAADSILNQ